MNKPIINIIIGIGSFVIIFFAGWNSWISLTLIAHGELLAHVNQWQIDADKHFDNLEKTGDDLNRKLDLFGPRLGVNTHVVYLSSSTTDFISQNK